MVKRLKPNLLDSTLEKKIIKTLKSSNNNNINNSDFFHNFYLNYVKKNIWIIILTLILILFLFYRYRNTKRNKEKKKLEEKYSSPEQYNFPIDNNKVYSDILLDVYNQQKESLREPKQNNGLAYPMFPYLEGGELISSKNK